MDTAQREAAFARLEAENTICSIQVKGIRFPLYMLTEDLPLLESVTAGQQNLNPRLEVLAPLDPMLWDRKLIEAIWDYHYSWEIYTPAAKRKYGYYVLPMLFGDRFIGRIEPKADKKASTLTIQNIWFEPGIRQTKKLSAQIEKSVHRLARFNNCI